MIVTVGRIGKAHGIRGAVTVQVLTDDPDRRFAVGTTLVSEPMVDPPLVIADARWHSGRLLLELEGIEDRTAAESLRGTLLQVEVDENERPSDPEEFYDHQLVGLPVRLLSGELIGRVHDVSHLPAQDLIIVRPDPATGPSSERGDILIPFVHEIVISVDLLDGLVVEPPSGLIAGSGQDAS